MGGQTTGTHRTTGPGWESGEPQELSPAEKRSALERVLQSDAFVRAGQLRNFLRYICEMELAARAGDLSEYLIGVEALGRPPGYSTADDSSVRRRAHALREKIDEVYRSELADDPVRIQLTKGNYVPRFVRANEVGRRANGDVLPPPAPGVLPPVRAVWLLAAAATGALATWAVVARPGASRAAVDPVLVEAWGPLARPGAAVAVCLAAHLHLGVLPYPEGPLPPMVHHPPQEAELRQWYQLHYPLEPDQRLGLHKATGPIRLGEVLGLVAAVRTFDRLGVDYQILAEKNVALPALRGRNLLLFGNPEYSAATARLLERAIWTVAYDPSRRDRVVRPRSGATGATYVPARDSKEFLSEVYGLITVLPSEGAAQPDAMRTVILSCTNSAGCQAAMEFFASPASLRALRERFRKEGLAGFPPAYQVVVRCKVHASQAISGEYESHVVLGKPGGA